MRITSSVCFLLPCLVLPAVVGAQVLERPGRRPSEPHRLEPAPPPAVETAAKKETPASVPSSTQPTPKTSPVPQPEKNTAPKKNAATAKQAAPAAALADASLVTWRQIATLPALPGQPAPGVAGGFAGALDHARAVFAGGSFYQEKGPLEGGERHFADAIWVLEQKAGGEGGQPVYAWVNQPAKLPRALACGASVALDDGVLCLGGMDGKECAADVFLLRWDDAARSVVKTDFPPLPKPLAFAGAGLAGSWVIVAGGTTTPDGRSGADVFGLDLSKRGDAAAFQWETLPAMPAALHFPMCVGQSDGEHDAFYVFGGRDLRPGQEGGISSATWKYTIATRSWSAAEKIQPASEAAPIGLMSGTGVALEPERVLLIGGDDGVVARFLESNAQRSGTIEEKECWARFNAALVEAHPGYRRDMLLYDARNRTWSKAGHFPQGTPAVAQAFLWDGAIVLAGGESRPGHRSAAVWLGALEAQ